MRACRKWRLGGKATWNMRATDVARNERLDPTRVGMAMTLSTGCRLMPTSKACRTTCERALDVWPVTLTGVLLRIGGLIMA